MSASVTTRLLDALHDGVFSLPAPLVDTAMTLAGPGSVLYPLIRRAQGYRPSPLPARLPVPDATVRVLIAPVNFAEQAWHWAHALERSCANTGARNVMLDFPGTFPFRADLTIPYGVFCLSKDWARTFFEDVCHYTHVLIEAEEPMFGPLFNFNVEKEVQALRSQGVSVAVLSHGSDTRSPSGHAQRFATSPFRHDNRDTQLLQRRSDRNRELIGRLNVPVFVSTPDLLDDLPQAHWCPLVVDPDEWGGTASQAKQDRSAKGYAPQVAHIPSRSWLKGTAQISPVLERLEARGIIENKSIHSVPRREMPAVLGRADIVVDQLTMGVYGATSLEAIASGCIPVAHVDERLRTFIEETTAVACPIVEAQAETLESVITALASDVDARHKILLDNMRYLATVHDGTLSARVLYDNWIASTSQATPQSLV